jgi:hypothetical protein
MASRDLLLLGGGVGLGLALSYYFNASPTPTTEDEEVPKKKLDTLMVANARLSEFVCAVFKYHGIPQEQAEEATEILVMADMRGIDSHGTARLFAYCKMLRAGLVNPAPNIRVVIEADSTATVDGKQEPFVCGIVPMNCAFR